MTAQGHNLTHLDTPAAELDMVQSLLVAAAAAAAASSSRTASRPLRIPCEYAPVRPFGRCISSSRRRFGVGGRLLFGTFPEGWWRICDEPGGFGEAFTHTHLQSWIIKTISSARVETIQHALQIDDHTCEGFGCVGERAK